MLAVMESSGSDPLVYHVPGLYPQDCLEADTLIDPVAVDNFGALAQQAEEDVRQQLLSGVDTREDEDEECDGIVRYHCDCCGCDISTSMRVRCEECQDFDLCVDCFCSGKQRGPHMRHHSYIPVGRHQFPLFTSDWTADEELALLEGVSRVGLGNWNEVAETVSLYSQRAKSKTECELHYLDYYFNTNECESLVRAIEAATKSSRFDFSHFSGAETLPGAQDRRPLTFGDDDMLAARFGSAPNDESTDSGIHRDCIVAVDNQPSEREPSALVGSPPIVGSAEPEPASVSASEIEGDKKKSDVDTKGVAQSSASAFSRIQGLTSSASTIIGHMPLRGDFDVEFDNDAELVVADMEVHGLETPHELELKLQVVELFNTRLDERILRKRTVVERGLLDLKKVQQQERRKLKDEKELAALLRPLTRFAPSSHLDRLVAMLLDERKIRQRLQLVAGWRAAGLKSLSDVKEHEAKKKNSTTSPGIAQAPQRKGRGPRKGEADIDIARKLPGGSLCSDEELSFCGKIDLVPMDYLMAKYILTKEEAKIDQETASQIIRLDAAKFKTVYDFVLRKEC